MCYILEKIDLKFFLILNQQLIVKMSETYTTIIPNTKDEEGNDVILKIIFKKNYIKFLR